MPKQVAELLAEARDLYAAAPSHAPICTTVEEGTHCVMTAVSEVADEYDAWSPICDYLRRAAKIGEGSIVAYNSRVTTEEMIAGFNKAIELAKEEDARVR